MSTINTDVWSHIFENTVQEDPSSLDTIRAVNRTWSETAENTPKLWTTLTLSQKRHFTDKEYAATHLKNSGILPLDITIALPDDVPYTSHIPIIDDLRDAVQRIRSLTLDVPYHEAWQHFVIGVGKGKAAPLLESLIIKVKDDVHDVANNGPFATFAECLTPSPKLKHFQFPAWPLVAAPPPQLATITSLAFDTPFSGLVIAELFPLVLATPNLEHFAFKSVDMGHESNPGFSNLITVPALLSANVTIPGFGLDLLRNFKAPLLRDVRLDGFRDEIPDHVWDMEDWGSDITQPCSDAIRHLTTHSSKVRCLELNYIHFANPVDDFQRIFTGQDLPELEELTLVKSNLPDAALVGGSSRIKKLVLKSCIYISKTGLLAFAQGRTRGDLELIVDNCPALSKEDIEALGL